MSNYTTPAQDAAEIRKAFKVAGIKASVRTQTYTGGSTIQVDLKKGSFKAAKEIALGFEKVDRCSVTGEILGGSNRYISVGIAESLLDEIKQLIWNAAASEPFEHLGVRYLFVADRLDNGEVHYFLQNQDPASLSCLSKYSHELQDVLEGAAEKIARNS